MKTTDLTDADWQTQADQLTLEFGQIAGLARCEVIKTAFDVAAPHLAVIIDLSDLHLSELQTQLLTAVRIMAERRWKEISDALPCEPGQKIYRLQNWPLALDVSREQNAVRLSERSRVIKGA